MEKLLKLLIEIVTYWNPLGRQIFINEDSGFFLHEGVVFDIRSVEKIPLLSEYLENPSIEIVSEKVLTRLNGAFKFDKHFEKLFQNVLLIIFQPNGKSFTVNYSPKEGFQNLRADEHDYLIELIRRTHRSPQSYQKTVVLRPNLLVMQG